MIIAVDFDGTLCTEKYPDIGEPIWETIKLVRDMHALGDTIILNTCRVDQYLTDALAWCKKYDVPIDYANENVPERINYYKIDSRKISADIYIEDRAINLAERFKDIKKYLGEKMSNTKTEVKKTFAEVCKTCIHKDLCKYAEAMSAKEKELNLEAPFELQCKQKQEQTITYPTHPYWPDGIRGFGVGTTTSKCSYSDSCGYWYNGKCNAPNNIAGLPCQQILCTTEAKSEVKAGTISECTHC